MDFNKIQNGKSILIDLELANYIQANRVSPSEDDNDILKRLLIRNNTGDVVYKEVTFHEGMELKYGNRKIEVRDGAFHCEGKSSGSPSGILKAINKNGTDRNGWDVIRYRDTKTQKWLLIRGLRDEDKIPKRRKQ